MPKSKNTSARTQRTGTQRAHDLEKRAIAGRKNVRVGKWKSGVPQTIATIDRVPLPPQRVTYPRQRRENRILGFSEYLNTLNCEHLLLNE